MSETHEADALIEAPAQAIYDANHNRGTMRPWANASSDVKEWVRLQAAAAILVVLDALDGG